MVAPVLYGVGATSVPGLTTWGSGFANSALAGGLASGAANLLGQSTNKSVNFRGKYERKRAQFARRQLGPDTRARVEAVKSAGLHPLAALGITPGASSMSNAGQIPGQSPDYGSAISEGLRTAQQMAGQSQRDTQSKNIAGLQVEEQQLRNDFLREQIKSSQMARVTQLANQMRPPVQNRPHPTEGERFTLMSPGGSTYDVRGGTSAQQLEDLIAEWANLMPDTMGRAWDTFAGQMRNSFGPEANQLKKHLQKRRQTYKKQFLNPDPYKGMGKSHY